MFSYINNTSFWAAFAVCVFAVAMPLFTANKKLLVAISLGACVLLLLPGWRTAAMAAFAIGVLWLYVFKWLRWYMPVVALAFIVLLLLLKPSSSGGRWFIVQRTVEMIAENPSGVGFGQFAVQYGKSQAAYFKQQGTEGKAALLADNVQFALNEYLQVMAEGGIALGVLFVLFTLGWLVLGVRLYRKHGNVCGLAAVTGFAALSVCNASFYMLHHWWSLLLWAICALTIVLLHWMPQRQVVWLTGVGLILSMAIIGQKTYKVIRDTHKLEMASQMSGMGYRANADSIFKSVDAGIVSNVVYLSAQARHCLLYNDARGAIVLLHKAATYQTHSDVCQLLGLAYLQAGDTAKAIVQFETETYMVPKLFMPRKQLADIYRALHNWEREKYWLESIVRTPIKIPNATSKEIVREARARLRLCNL